MDTMVLKSAALSDCGTYRFSLHRDWNLSKWVGRRIVAWLLNNPSTADASVDDQTIRKCMKYCRDWGYDGMVFLNSNPYRSTDYTLAKMPPERIRILNRRVILQELQKSTLIIAAWGSNANKLLVDPLMEMMVDKGYPLNALELSKNGVPKHPLYLKGSLLPQLIEDLL